MNEVYNFLELATWYVYFNLGLTGITFLLGLIWLIKKFYKKRKRVSLFDIEYRLSNLENEFEIHNISYHKQKPYVNETKKKN